MNYPKNIEQKIGFDSIRNHLLLFCHCDLGIQEINSISFSNNKNLIEDSLNKIAECKRIIEFENEFPIPSYEHVFNEIQQIKPLETFLQIIDLHRLRKSLLEINAVNVFLIQNAEIYPTIAKNILDNIPNNICESINTIIDTDGYLKDNASKKLIEIRQSIRIQKQIISKIMNQKLSLAKKEGWLDSDSELTICNNRLVLPLISAYKRKIKGIVHDESITGKTSYVEPIEAFEVNNAIISLEYEEQKEIIRILKEITAEIRPYIPDIENAYLFLGTIDALFAKAHFAIKIQANKPIISKHTEISLIGAKHPLLLLSFKKSGKQVVPLKVNLDSHQRILVISGPNAGGKSVCLKTIFLLQYMFQCGLLIPADEYSTLGIFNKVFIDIGDEQSIENDLSTYSSHITNMKYFIEFSDAKTLICIDEFGTGTEPMLGGAIAESVLENLHNKGVYGVITTHYTNLKHAASALPKAINGAMLFDLTEMKPLFKLRIGSAGSSFAFEIAKEIGLPVQIIENAKLKIGKEHVDFDKNLKKIEEEKQYIFKKKDELKRREDELLILKNSYSQKINELNSRKLDVISDAKKEVASVLHQANQQIEQTIRNIKEIQADKEKTKKIRIELEQKSKQLLSNLDTKEQQLVKKKSNNKLSKTDKEYFEINDFVSIKGQETIGKIIKIEKNKLTVEFNHATIQVNKENLIKANKPKQTQTQTKTIITTSTNTISEKRNTFSPKLDIRGKRADEAMYEVKDFLETAYMLQVKHIEILHGKGYGILRKIIRDYIDTQVFIQEYFDAPIEMGGDGITIIKLK